MSAKAESRLALDHGDTLLPGAFQALGQLTGAWGAGQHVVRLVRTGWGGGGGDHVRILSLHPTQFPLQGSVVRWFS